jgi:O-acetyl-ADP-ribose deacetylase (regulator of RNase III)
MKHKISETEIEIIKDDITLLDTDAIVNPANNYLMHHGGLAAAIVKRGGKIIQEESRKIGNLPTGSAAITSGGRLRAKYVIHTVGPRYRDGKSGEAEKLASAVSSALKIAVDKKLNSIAIPAISSGIFGYPIEHSSKIIVETVCNFIKSCTDCTLRKVILCLYDENTFNNFVNALKEIINKVNQK